MNPRTVVFGAAFALLAVALALVSLSVGTTKLPVADVIQSLIGGGDSGTRLIVIELRLPRVAAGLLVGLAFAVSGALLQTLARNPLASPDIVGVNSSASAAAVTVIVLAGTGGNINGMVNGAERALKLVNSRTKVVPGHDVDPELAEHALCVPSGAAGPVTDLVPPPLR